MRCSVCGHNCLVYAKERRMRFLILLFAVVLLVVVTIAEFADPPSTEDIIDTNRHLRLVHVVFRHGIRTPADTYPRDIHINQTFHPYGWGQLTNSGKLQQFETGEYLRERYNHFLGDLYSTSLVYAQSTDTDRAYMSCAVTLAGLWPPKGTDLEWNHDLNWSPAPIKSEPLSEDTLLLARKNCPRYFEELKNVFKTADVQHIMKDNEDLFRELTEITGMNIESPDDVQSIYNTLKAEEEYGLRLPRWTEDYYPDKLIPLTEISFILNAYNNELKKLKGGPLLKKILSDWKAKSENKISPKDRKIFVYSGHDSTVSNLMLALGTWDKQIPQYGITILLELYEDTSTNQYEVEIYLRNSTSVEPFILTVPGCEEACPLSKMIELTKDVIPNNWAEECKAKDPNYKPPPPSGP